MLKIIRDLLAKLVYDIDTNNTNISLENLYKILRILSNINLPNLEMSKTQAAEYMNVSVSTFEKRVSDGIFPKGTSVPGFKEKRWYKPDLDLCKIKEL